MQWADVIAAAGASRALAGGLTGRLAWHAGTRRVAGGVGGGLRAGSRARARCSGRRVVRSAVLRSAAVWCSAVLRCAVVWCTAVCCGGVQWRGSGCGCGCGQREVGGRPRWEVARGAAQRGFEQRAGAGVRAGWGGGLAQVSFWTWAGGRGRSAQARSEHVRRVEWVGVEGMREWARRRESRRVKAARGARPLIGRSGHRTRREDF